MHVVLSIGGSSIIPDGKPDLGFLKAVSSLIKRSKNSFGILCGGGTVARLYANAARELGAGEYEADSIAIRSTKQNAHLLITALKGAGVDVFDRVIDDFEYAKEPARESKAVVMGGTIPGITTDTDSVLLAEAIGAKRLVNVSNVDAIYDSDPRKNPGAKKFGKMGYDELVALASASDKRMAGTNFVFDLLACKLIARSKIETHFVSFRNMGDLEAAVEGKKHGGTVVG
ncbi:MAG TPA: UMP kinase [Candidatus Bilamarchaeum sp.]|nr:UMP kinase [Candidatus Bilamarchaeum sp.]